ncbi:MAG: response regulator [Bacteroidales bacterium]|nr:response regulator [Bacteroidales bacterium]
MVAHSSSNGTEVIRPDSAEQPVIYDWSDKIILIAEDEETNYLFLKAALARTNAAIIWAKNGQEAVDAVKHHPEIDVVLMDIKMPVMNGVDATRIIRELDREKIVIAQTAYISEKDRLTYMEAGCNDFLAKPITRDRLLRMISQYI